jgi:hypothetical protein
VNTDATPILLLGDSTALASSDGVFAASSELGVRSVAFAGAGCPALDGKPFAKAETCPQVQETYLRLIEEIGPRLVILVNRYDLYVGPLGNVKENDHRILMRSGTLPRSQEESLANVADSVGRFVRAQIAADREVVVKLQPPPGVFLNRTLFEKWFPSRALARSDDLDKIVDQREAIRNALQTELIGLSGVTVLDVGEEVCGNPEFCLVEFGENSLYGDFSHLNSTGSRRLVETWKRLFEPLLRN